MSLLARLRASSAFWFAPFAIALTLLSYFFGSSGPRPGHLGYAPTLVANALGPLYTFAYATAMALGVWESGRLAKSKIWELAPTRSHYHIAAQALLPVLLLPWMMLVLPVAGALVETSTPPTLDSVYPLLMAMTVCVAHGVIGFGIGRHVPHMIAAPVAAVLTFIVVGSTVTTGEWWKRHVSGQYPEIPRFGEAADPATLIPHILFTAGIAAAVALLWLPVRVLLLRVVLSGALAFASMAGAQHMVRGWGPIPPMLIGHGTLTCVGDAPKVCMAEGAADNIDSVHRYAESVLQDYRAAGVSTPEMIIDASTDGRSPQPSTSKVWRAGLSVGERHGTVRFQVMRSALHYSCGHPDLATAQTLGLWTAEVTGEEAANRKRMQQEQELSSITSAQWSRIRGEVDRIRRAPAQQQGAWFEQNLTRACSKGAK
ncbi:hypothetical protein OG978_26230 [Streptomyces sp. NBC_01591]|uniref:DUF7224 domain-containing protein n=1 Tax=Streptomyces sp. NBC_01591 TaxID=2975888 RepID=UPI002DD8B2F6|nr:hypothetical protein [Streptomyces sp. NBC_01591]WSD70568.1 hypothetical protein OG978_26230 [Streptomyces sp. NBC_01591]